MPLNQWAKVWSGQLGQNTRHHKFQTKCSRVTHDDVDPQDLPGVLSVEDLHAKECDF